VATWFVGADVVDGTGREPVAGAAVEVEGGRIAANLPLGLISKVGCLTCAE
jgi:hypothetical protein